MKSLTLVPSVMDPESVPLAHFVSTAKNTLIVIFLTLKSLVFKDVLVVQSSYLTPEVSGMVGGQTTKENFLWTTNTSLVD